MVSHQSVDVGAVLQQQVRRRRITEPTRHVQRRLRVLHVPAPARRDQSRVVHGLGWVGSDEMDPWTTLDQSQAVAKVERSGLITACRNNV